MYYTRNRDLSYYEGNFRANCGSYALRLNEWYDPEEYVDDLVGNIDTWIEELSLEGYADWEIATKYAELILDGMLKEFDGELEECDGNIIKEPEIELIALCGWCTYNKEWGSDWDFHFKVFRDGKWMEKNGSGPVIECDADDWGRYNGDVFYMYHWIGDVA